MYQAKGRGKGSSLHKLPIYLEVSETTGTQFSVPIKYKQICQVLSPFFSLSSLPTTLPMSLIPVLQNSGHVRSKTSLPQPPCFHSHAVPPPLYAIFACAFSFVLWNLSMMHGKLEQALESGEV